MSKSLEEKTTSVKQLMSQFVQFNLCETNASDIGKTIKVLDRRISINTQLNLKVPYHSQLNNLEHPLGACNVVTCVAIVLKYYGIDSRSAQEINNDVQLEDALFRKTKDWDEQ